MKKFKFRLETLMMKRKSDQDIAQREYAEAQRNLSDQLAQIQFFYSEVDSARIDIENCQAEGGSQHAHLQMLEEFIEGQKIRIQFARQKARELMQIAEEKHEILTEKMRDFKILEKLKEKQKIAHTKEKNRKMVKDVDDIVIMRSRIGGTR